jgi:hypothetical protein
VDLNGDGNIDLLTGSYTGLVYILYGNNDGSFKEVVVLTDKSGTDIHLDTYFDFKKNNFVSLGKKEKKKLEISGFDEFNNFDQGNIGSIITPHDWDNDGDFDLVISRFDGGVKVRINEGTKTNPVFGIKNIEIASLPEHHANVIIDWDGDGLWDIVGGSKFGGVYFYKNIGKLGVPAFGKVQCIIEPTEIYDKMKSECLGLSNIAVTDYNKDGKLDLLIGSPAKVVLPKIHLTPEQRKEIQNLEKEAKKLDIKIEELFDKFKKKFKNKEAAWEAMQKDKKASILLDQQKKVWNKLMSKTPRKRAYYGYLLLSLRK